MKKIILTIMMILAFFVSANLKAQGGKQFAEFAKQLEPYFDKLMIDDIKAQLPLSGDYKIWGWDVGDFSGDGYVDCALAIKLRTDKKKRMHVYLFADIDGFLKKIGHFPYYYVETPLEIGVSIANNEVGITRKSKKYFWDINSYTYHDGVVIHTSTFTTKRIGDLTYEKTVNYMNLTNIEKFVYTRSGEVAFLREYSTVLAYPRGKQIFKGYTKENFINDIDYVYFGAWDWEGDSDLSYRISAAYDTDYLYFTMNVSDEKIVVRSCDDCIVEDNGGKLSKTCDSCFCDYIDMWIDTYTPLDSTSNRFMNIKNNRIQFRNSAERSVMKFTIYPGDFYSNEASVEIATNDYLDSYQRFDTRKLKATANLTDEGYVVKFRLPFTLLGFEGCPAYGENRVELGASFCVIDYDNKFRDGEKTELANSPLKPNNPTTYGSLLIMPYTSWYGESYNIFEIEMLQTLREYGF